MKYLKGRWPSGSMVVAVIALVIACAGTAVAAATISGKDIVNSTLTGKDVKDESLKVKDLSEPTRNALRGQTGPAGQQGIAGPQGARGEIGPAGPAGADGVDGEDGADGVDGEDGEDGEDGVDGEDGTDVGPTEFGVARLYQDGTAVAANWSADVPDDGNNAAQVAGSTVVTCEAGDVFSLQGAMRTDEADGGQGGAGLIVTTASGDLLAAGQTAPSATFPGTRVVNVSAFPKTSNEPTGADDSELVSVTIPGGVPSGSCVVEGTAQFFDFDDNGGTEG